IAVVRSLAQGPAQWNGRGSARQDLRAGPEPLARRGGLAARPRPAHETLPARGARAIVAGTRLERTRRRVLVRSAESVPDLRRLAVAARRLPARTGGPVADPAAQRRARVH